MTTTHQRPISKTELHESFHALFLSSLNDDSDIDDDEDEGSLPYRSVYWSPSGGTSATPLYVPVSNVENDIQRQSLVPILTSGGVYTSRTINVNLFDSGLGGSMYRSMEIVHDLVLRCGGTSLPLGWDCKDSDVVLKCLRFRANTISGSPSRLVLLAGYVLRHCAEAGQHGGSSSCGGGKDAAAITSLRNELNRWRAKIRTMVFACEPMHDARASLLRRAFPNVQFASILGGAEVGCWGVSIPGMHYNTFLFDTRVVDVKVFLENKKNDANIEWKTHVAVDCVEGGGSDTAEVDGESSPSGMAPMAVGPLVVTCHLRRRFPVRNFDTGDVGSIVPASHVCCSDTNTLSEVEAAVAKATWVNDIYKIGQSLRDNGDNDSETRQTLPLPMGGNEHGPLLRGVIYSSRGGPGNQKDNQAGGSGSDEFHALEHNLNAITLLERALGFASCKGTELCDNDLAKMFVNGQVVVKFDEMLREMIDVRLLFSVHLDDSSAVLASDTLKQQQSECFAQRSCLLTAVMREWILSTLHDDQLANAMTVTISADSGLLQTTTTASNRNKIPTLLDLRGDRISGRESGDVTATS